MRQAQSPHANSGIAYGGTELYDPKSTTTWLPPMSTLSPAIPFRENATRGIVWMLATMFWFVTLDALAKYALQSYPLIEVLWGRFFFHMLFVTLAMGMTVRQHIKSANLPLQMLRSVLMCLTTILFFSGLQSTPLATASTIMFLSPILVTVLAIPLLGEQVGPRRWAGVVVGFIGAMIVVRPDVSGLSLGSLSLLSAAFTNSLYQIMTRKVRLNDDPMTTLFYTAVVGAVVMSVAAPFTWVQPALKDWGILMCLGIAGGLGHLCLIRAFRSAPASLVAPFGYTSLLWATLFGYALFSELPDRWTLTGAALIIGSGLLIFYREHKIRQQAAG